MAWTFTGGFTLAACFTVQCFNTGYQTSRMLDKHACTQALVYSTHPCPHTPLLCPRCLSLFCPAACIPAQQLWWTICPPMTLRQLPRPVHATAAWTSGSFQSCFLVYLPLPAGVMHVHVEHFEHRTH